MRLVARDDYHFNVIKGLCIENFSGVERPPEDMLRFQYDHSEVFVHETYSKEIIAYVMIVMQPEPYIWSVATKTEFRSRGIASGLIGEAIQWYRIRGAKMLELTVNVNNPAQKMYFDLGFRATHVLRRYYDEDSGIRMRRIL